MFLLSAEFKRSSLVGVSQHQSRKPCHGDGCCIRSGAVLHGMGFSAPTQKRWPGDCCSALEWALH